jgi:ABC-type branched-subunit amino acid transport system ATPase component
MPAILEVSNLSKRFGGVQAVREVSMKVEEGSITAVIGPNGAGKTSLFNVISGFEPPSAGTVRFGGSDIGGLAPWQVARVGLVRTFQTPVGFPALSVLENLIVGGMPQRAERLISAILGGWRGAQRETYGRAAQLLDDLGLWDLRSERLSDLTPGDVKLVDFARQLMSSPRMILLDEPASGVDPGSIERLAQRIRRVRDGDGVTVLVIDHNIGFVLGIADRVHVMSLGEVVASGAPDQITHDPRVIEIYLGGSR